MALHAVMQSRTELLSNINAAAFCFDKVVSVPYMRNSQFLVDMLLLCSSVLYMWYVVSNDPATLQIEFMQII